MKLGDSRKRKCCKLNFIRIYNGITGVGLALVYFPHNHARAKGHTKAEILRKIDYVGGLLSIIGLTLL